MAYRHVVTNDQRVFLVSAVKHGIVLHIYLIAHCYIMNIAADYGIVPNTAVFSHGNIANDSCGFCQKCIIAYLWALTQKFFY